MSGVAILLHLLHADAALIGLVPAGRVMADDLPLGTALPAISVTLISSVDMNLPTPTGSVYVTDRVQVTVLAATYPEQQQLLRAVRKAAADKLYPSIDGYQNVTVFTDHRGPDFVSDTGNIRIGTQDFRVKYNEDR